MTIALSFSKSCIALDSLLLQLENEENLGMCSKSRITSSTKISIHETSPCGGILTLLFFKFEKGPFSNSLGLSDNLQSNRTSERILLGIPNSKQSRLSLRQKYFLHLSFLANV